MSQSRKHAPKSSPGRAAGPRAVDARERIHRIVEAAVALADEGGFEGVRTRDVCERAGVSMSALYRVFHSKEEILLSAFAEDLLLLEAHVARRPVEGETPELRVGRFFRFATGAFLERPSYARAVIAAMGSGQSRSLAQLEAVVHRMTKLIDDAITARGTDGSWERDPEDPERAAIVLHRVWFALLVGWSASVYSTEQVFRELDLTARFVLNEGRRARIERADRTRGGE
ncbi:MAG: TetR/AcrR family transcriptional regulator [Polyangiales bacterium]